MKLNAVHNMLSKLYLKFVFVLRDKKKYIKSPALHPLQFTGVGVLKTVLLVDYKLTKSIGWFRQLTTGFRQRHDATLEKKSRIRDLAHRSVRTDL